MLHLTLHGSNGPVRHKYIKAGKLILYIYVHMRMPTDTHTDTYTHIHTRIHIVLHSIALGTDIGHQGYAIMSSTFASESANKATDDNGDDDYGHNTCSRTQTENSPWWTLYFRKVVSVREVIIVNPNCCGK